MSIIRICIRISYIPYYLEVTLFMNRPILVQFVCKNNEVFKYVYSLGVSYILKR